MQSAHQATKFLRRDTTPSQFPHVDVGPQKARQLLLVGQAAVQNVRQLAQLDPLDHLRVIETATFGDPEQHSQQP